MQNQSDAGHSYFYHPLLFALLVSSLYAVLLSAYISAEHRFLFWDNYAYYLYNYNLLAAFRTSFQTGIDFLAISMRTDYNVLFAVPGAALMSLFGDSRAVQAVINYFVYGASFQFVFAGFCAAALRSRRVWPVAYTMPLALPVLMSVFSIGLPDLGGATLVMCGLWAYLTFRHDRRWQAGLLLGISLGLAFVFRRHFAYAGVAVFITIILQDLWLCWRSKRHCAERHNVRLDVARSTAMLTGIAAIACIATVFIIIPFYAMHALAFNVGQAYAAYKVSSYDAMIFYGTTIGYGLLILSLGGYLWQGRRIDCRYSALLPGLFVVWALLWLGYVKFSSQNYALQILPMVVCFGLVLLWHGCGSLKRRHIGLGLKLALTMVLILNLAGTLRMDGEAFAPVYGKVRFLQSRQAFPITDENYDVERALIDYLRRMSQPNDKIYVAASSGIFNRDIIINGEGDLYGRTQRQLDVLPTSDVDGRDPAPYDMVAQATIFVVPSRDLLHLIPALQRSITSVSALFAKPGLFRDGFDRQQENFTLADGTVLNIWRRNEKYSASRLAAGLASIRTSIAGSALPTQDWTMIEAFGPFAAKHQADGSTKIRGHVGGLSNGQPLPRQSRYIYLDQPAGPTLTGTIAFSDKRCIGANLVLTQGDLRKPADVSIPVKGDTIDPQAFQLTLGQIVNGQPLILNVQTISAEPGAGNYCSFTLNDLHWQN